MRRRHIEGLVHLIICSSSLATVGEVGGQFEDIFCYYGLNATLTNYFLFIPTTWIFPFVTEFEHYPCVVFFFPYYPTFN